MTQWQSACLPSTYKALQVSELQEKYMRPLSAVAGGEWEEGSVKKKKLPKKKKRICIL